MPSIRVSGTIAAGGSNTNVLVGSAFEFAPSAEEVEVAITQTAPSAGTVGQLVADVQFGPEVTLEGGPVPAEIGVSQGPRLPDNIIVADFAAPGDRLKVALRETGGADPVPFVVMVRTRPLG